MGGNDTHCYFGVRQTLEAPAVFKRLLFFIYMLLITSQSSETFNGSLQKNPP